jgi:ribosomal protein L40E
MPEAMPDLVRCPECGAANPARATWCGQCLRRFDEGPRDAQRPAVEQHAGGAASVRTAAGPVVQARDGEEPAWTCPACESENPLSSDVCARCGSAFTSFFAPAVAEIKPRASSRAAIVCSAILPGAGHVAYRQSAAAVARGLLYVWGLGVAIMLLARPPVAARALVRGIGVCFAMAAAGIWLVSMLEVMRFGEGHMRPLIPPKALTWVTAGMSSLLFLGLLVAIIAAR